MPIRTLEVKPDSALFETIRNAVIAIDVNHYLTSIMNVHFDSNFEAIGGFPISLENKILSDVAVFEKYGIKPVYIFPGIKTPTQLSYVNQKELPYEKSMTKYWETKSTNTNISSRDITNPFLLSNLMDELIIILQENELEYLISPYVQHHQMYYMLKEGIVDCIYTSDDALLLNIENFILGIDFESETFFYMNNEQFLKQLGIPFKKFIEISMCLGNVYQPSNLLVSQPTNFKQLVFSTMPTGFNVYAFIPDTAENAPKLRNFIRGCTLLDYCPVLKLDGRVEPIDFECSESLIKDKDAPVQSGPTIKTSTDKRLPAKLTEVFGFHVSDELYFYQSIGLPVFKYIEAFETDTYFVRMPTDMIRDTIYDQMLYGHASMEKREYLFNLFTSCLHRYFQNKKMKLEAMEGSKQSWHNIEYKFTITDNSRALLVRHATAKSFDIHTFLSSLDNNYLDESSMVDASPSSVYVSSSHELISTAFLRTLTTYKFVESSKERRAFVLTAWGEALTKFLKKHNIDYEMTIILFIFLQRVSDLKLDDLAKSSDLNDIKEKVENISVFHLISKFASLYRIKKFIVSNYKGPVSRSLLHFNSTVSLLRTELKDFVAIHLLTILFLNKNDEEKFTRDNQEWAEIASEVPFKRALPNTIGGLITQVTLRSSLDLSDGEKLSSKLETELAPFQSILENPVIESLNSLKFVETVCDMVDVLGESNLVGKKMVRTFSDVREKVADIINLF